jgi:hypothetical protein
MKTKPSFILALLLVVALSYYYPWLPLLLVKCLREWLLTPKANFRPVRPGLPKPGFFPLLILILLIHPQASPAQTKPQTMQPGEYYLEGVREVASGFQFNADHTFGFYFVYGAVDRLGQGTWQRKGDSLILNGPRKPEKDFKLVASRKVPGNRVTIQVKNPNEQVLTAIYCEIQTPGGPMQARTRSEHKGRITFDAPSVQSISLIHGYWPDRYSDFPVTDPTHNYFQFTIEPHITDVEFRDLILQVTSRGLTGPHPLMEGDDLEYVRNE